MVAINFSARFAPLVESGTEAENERLRALNLNLQDRMTECVGPITDAERLELIRYRVSYPSLVLQYEALCQRLEELTGSDPRLPTREADMPRLGDVQQYPHDAAFDAALGKRARESAGHDHNDPLSATLATE